MLKGYNFPQYGRNDIDNARWFMFWDYNDYLRGMWGEPPIKVKARGRFVLDTYAGVTWIPAVEEDLEVGFLILGNPPHPDCDFYIQDAYIIPEYQGHGTMSKLIRSLPVGRYSLFVLENNIRAQTFWKHIFGRVYSLRDVLPPVRGCMQWGFLKETVSGEPFPVSQIHGAKMH